MVGKAYLSRQMTALLNFASQTNNPELSALLVQKAARLKSQADEITPSEDIGPSARRGTGATVSQGVIPRRCFLRCDGFVIAAKAGEDPNP